MSKNKKGLILLIITIVIIIAGLVVVWKYGFKYDLLYGKNTKVKIELGFNFDECKLEPIVNDLFDEYKLQKSDTINSTAVITVKDISDEQKNSLIEKINEVYGKELTVDNLKISNSSNVDIKAIVNQYIWMIIITTAIIEVYMIIRFRKVGIIRAIIIPLIIITLSQIITISLIAILRIEIGVIVMPILLAIFIIDWYIINLAFEENLLKLRK